MLAKRPSSLENLISSATVRLPGIQVFLMQVPGDSSTGIGQPEPTIERMGHISGDSPAFHKMMPRKSVPDHNRRLGNRIPS